jgi:hypothetical protein
MAGYSPLPLITDWQQAIRLTGSGCAFERGRGRSPLTLERGVPAMPTRSVAKRGHKTRKAWAAECRGWLRKTTEGLIGLGKTLIKAKHDLNQHGDWLPMLDDLKMDVRFAQRVMALARNPRFSKAANLTHLPYALSALG